MPGYEFYLGAMRYCENPAGEIISTLNDVGPIEIGKGRNRAATLLKKRIYFSHEQEVRIILVAPKDFTADNFQISIDPNFLFDEVQFDPRLVSFERIEREKTARDLGYTGKFGQNYNYQMTLFQAILDNPKWL